MDNTNKIQAIINRAETTGKLHLLTVKKFITPECYSELSQNVRETRQYFSNKPNEVLRYAKLFRMTNYYNTKADNAKNEQKTVIFRRKAESLEESAREVCCEIYAKNIEWFVGHPFCQEYVKSSPYQHSLPIPAWYKNYGSQLEKFLEHQEKLKCLYKLIDNTEEDEDICLEDIMPQFMLRKNPWHLKKEAFKGILV